MSNRNIRVKANLLKDKYLKVNIEQDFENLEILSLRINKDETIYKKQTSNYGCVVGRVIANGNFGIPNAKISIFIPNNELKNGENPLNILYPFYKTSSLDSNNVRYNLLTEESIGDCFQPVGTFPSKRMVLDDNNVIEVFEKYYKFTTRTNDAGDYMIFGVPVGSQTIHYDLDISDCGILSQSPRDLIYKGYNANSFASASMFKKSENLDSLPQIYSSNETVDVLPFWGDSENNAIAITRKDFKVDYEFQPTCVFIGSILMDNESNGINKSCNATKEAGLLEKMTTGSGTIEMIRKTANGSIEEFQINATQLIDENGVWCYQIPMNLDYVTMDEYGNIVPTDDPNNGIATRARVRFRFSVAEDGNEAGENHFTKVLVPNNPKEQEDLDYVFGTNSKDDEFGTKSFRDLFWNKVYTVKSYIPRIQEGNYDEERRFTGIKEINFADNVNKFPYNNMRVFEHGIWGKYLACHLFRFMLRSASFINKYLGGSLTIGDGMCPDLQGWYFCPNCKNLEAAYKKISESKDDLDDETSVEHENSTEQDICVTNNVKYFISCVEETLMRENRNVVFDFYNDWINGALYIPRWFATARKKRRYRLNSKTEVETTIEACMENTFSESYRRYTQQCALKYAYEAGKGFTKLISNPGCTGTNLTLIRKATTKDGSYPQECHWKEGRLYYRILRKQGLVHEHKTYLEDSVYYMKPCEWGTMMADQHIGSDYRSDIIKRCPLFATDIVLLGTFNSCDRDGIKDVLRDLESTTYKMPPFLVESNMQTDGSMYTDKNGDVICNRTSDGVEKKEETFTDYEEWSSKQDLYDSEDADMKEYAITLESGVAWNRLGPNQGYNSKSKLFYPGGHFLGFSCNYTATNVKSCVNLSRMCEIGVIPSSRKSVIVDKTTGSVPKYGWAHFIPNGLIAKDNITKEEFRTMFAVLNYNGLRTKKDENGRLVYDFSYISPKGFNGDLREYTSGAPYNEERGHDYGQDVARSDENGDYAYYRTLEEFNNDYYCFRLGVENNATREELRKKYLFEGVENGTHYVALPVYENSYFFYFGLDKGKTALDKFFNEYYAPCPNPNAYKSRFTIEETGSIGICDEAREEEGKIIEPSSEVTIQIYDMDGPYLVYLYQNEKSVKLSLYKEEEKTKGFVLDENGSEFGEINKRNFVIKGLTKGEYTIVIGSITCSSIEQAFTIKVQTPAELEGIDIEGTNFVTDVELGMKDGELIKGNFFSYKSTSLVKKENKWKYLLTESRVVADYYEWISAPDLKGDYVYTRKEVGGYISLPNLLYCSNFKGYVIRNTNGYVHTYSGGTQDIDELSYLTHFEYANLGDGTVGGIQPAVWDSNTKFYIFALWSCDEEEQDVNKFKMVYIGQAYIASFGHGDIYFGDSSVSVRRAMDKGISVWTGQDEEMTGIEWWIDEYAKVSSERKYLKNEISWIFKKGIFYHDSAYNFKLFAINSGIMEETSGVTSFKVTYEADKYKYVNSGETENEMIDVGDKIDYWALPTSVYLPENSYRFISESDLKKNYIIVYKNKGDGHKLPFNCIIGPIMDLFPVKYIAARIPLLYKPFYTRVVLMQYSNADNTYNTEINISSINGVSDNGVMGPLQWRLVDDEDTIDNTITGITKQVLHNRYQTIKDVDFTHEICYAENVPHWYYRWEEGGREHVDGFYYSLEEMFSYTNTKINTNPNDGKQLVMKGDKVQLNVSLSEGKNDNFVNEIIPIKKISKINSHFFGNVTDSEFSSSSGTHYFRVLFGNLIIDGKDRLYTGASGNTVTYNLDFTHIYENEPLTLVDFSNVFNEWKKYTNENLDDIEIIKEYKKKGWLMFVADENNMVGIPLYWQGISTQCYNGLMESRKIINSPFLVEIDIKAEKINYKKMEGYQYLGIYDNSIKDLTQSEINNMLGNRENRFKYIAKHNNEISSVRWYKKDNNGENEFINILKKYRGETK